MTELLHRLLDALTAPATQLLDPGKRVFAPFLLLAVIIGLVRSAPKQSPWRRLSELLSPSVYLHPSARLDYKLLWVKALLKATLLAPLFVSALTITKQVHHGLQVLCGPPPLLTLPPLLLGLLCTLTLFLLDDFSHFALHLLMHRIPFLWTLHKVHHSAEVLTPFSLYRTHPLEGLLSGLRGALTMGTATGILIYLFGSQLHCFELLGVDAIGFVWSLCGANLRHSHVFLSYGERIEQWLISPAQHQLHHSADRAHSDRNFGTVLAVWDRLLGTHLSAHNQSPPRFGIDPAVPQPYPTVMAALLRPLEETGIMLQTLLFRSRAVFRTGLGLSVLLCLFGCTSSKRIDRAALLRSFGEAALTSYRSFEQEATRLAQAIEQDKDAPSIASQTAWKRAMAAWQHVELFQFGPLASAPSAGALGLRNKMYAFPDQSRCVIDQQLVSRIYEGELFAATADSGKGLGALEYLLFYKGTDNGCAADAAINTMGTWAAISASELQKRKVAYAKAAVADLLIQARALTSAWEQGNFQTQLSSAGQGSVVYVTQQAALNAVSEALFYLEVMVKDRKLAQPLGLRSCTKPQCPESLESLWADADKEHLQNNLQGFRSLFLGGQTTPDALGFDDLLRSVSADDVAARILRDIDGAQAALAQLGDQSLSQKLQSDSLAVLRVHDAVKLITDSLKQDFTAALSIQPPRRVEGDHD